MFFLAEKFVLSKIIRIFAATESATLPIWTANQGGSFAFSVGTPKERSTIQKGALKDSDTIQKEALKDSDTIQKEALKDSNTIQKSDSTTQKSESATQKGQFEDIGTTQKSEIATQKNLDTIQKEVLEYFKGNPKATRVDAANALGNITEDGVKFIIAKLQKKGLLKRVGGRKHGEWQVL